MDGDSSKIIRLEGLLDVSAKTLSHNKKKEGGEGVPLSYASGGFERAGGKTIDKEGEMGGGDKAHDPTNPGRTKAKSFQHMMNVRPAELVESFGEIKFE